VELVEKARFPRDKLCGEFVSSEGCRVLDRLGVLSSLLSRGCIWMEDCRITDVDGRALQLPLPDLDGRGPEALGVSRATLDTALLERAAAAGTSIRQGWRAVDPIVDDGRVVGCVVEAPGSGRRMPLRARVVAAADGRRSLLVRRFHPRLGDPSRSHSRSWFGLKAHLPVTGSSIGRRVELHLFHGGYCGLAPVERERINICLMVTVGTLRAHGGSPARLFERSLRRHPGIAPVVGDAPTPARWLSVGPLRFGARRPVTAGALFVGDAAGTIDPFCGEGISNALVAAELAAPVAVAAAAEGRLSRQQAQAYRSQWQARFAPVTRRVRWLGRLFAHPRLAGAGLRLLGGVGGPLAPRLLAVTRTGHGA
jgi:flavin-dependent dehydrogenase